MLTDFLPTRRHDSHVHVVCQRVKHSGWEHRIPPASLLTVTLIYRAGGLPRGGMHASVSEHTSIQNCAHIHVAASQSLQVCITFKLVRFIPLRQTSRLSCIVPETHTFGIWLSLMRKMPSISPKNTNQWKTLTAPLHAYACANVSQYAAYVQGYTYERGKPSQADSSLMPHYRAF